MKFILTSVGFILLITTGIAIIGGLVVLLAYGIGWVLMLFLPFNTFEATLLSLLGMTSFVLMGTNIVRRLSEFVMGSYDDDEDEDLDWLWDEDDDLDEDYDLDDDVQQANPRPGIPRWRQSSRPIEIPEVDPDEKCPCGSGRKYKNCHGRKSKA